MTEDTPTTEPGSLIDATPEATANRLKQHPSKVESPTSLKEYVIANAGPYRAELNRYNRVHRRHAWSTIIADLQKILGIDLSGRYRVVATYLSCPAARAKAKEWEKLKAKPPQIGFAKPAQQHESQLDQGVSIDNPFAGAR